MTTISDVRDRIRIDLHDDAATRWPDEALDRHIARSLADISNASPRERSALIATTPGSRDIDISPLTGLIRVESVEYPVGAFPSVYVPFARWQETLSLHSPAVPTGDDARIFYTAMHELDEVGTTLPVHLEDVLATGAAAYAALELSAATTDALSISGNAPADFASLGRAWMSAFRELLRDHSRRNRLTRRRLYVPA